MQESDLVTKFLHLAGASKPSKTALGGELISSFDKLTRASESTLQSMYWPKKDGDLERVFDERSIKKVFGAIAQIQFSMGESGLPRAELLRAYTLNRIQIEQLSDFFSCFLDVSIASALAEHVGKYDVLYRTSANDPTTLFMDKRVPETAIEAIIQTIDQARLTRQTHEEFRIELMRFANRTTLATLALRVTYTAQGIVSSSAFSSMVCVQLQRELARAFARSDSINTSLLQATKEVFGTNVATDPRAPAVYRRVAILLSDQLSRYNQQALLAIWKAVDKVLFEKIPKFTTEAIKTVNPFLIRPLFLSFPSVQTFAIAAKLSSSLETMWGTLLEHLFVASSRGARRVGDGGVDVVVERRAFDIKSGPAVMNNDQVNVMVMKARRIADGEVPTLDSFQVALAYGRTKQIFSTMSGHISNKSILPARDAWHEITGDWLAPEKAYALCGLVADTIGVDGIIEAATEGGSASTSTHLQDESAFEQLFADAIDAVPHGVTEDEELRMLRALRENSAQV